MKAKQNRYKEGGLVPNNKLAMCTYIYNTRTFGLIHDLPFPGVVTFHCKFEITEHPITVGYGKAMHVRFFMN